MKKNYDSRFRRVESKQLRAGPKGSKGDKGGIGQTGMPGVIREGRKGFFKGFNSGVQVGGILWPPASGLRLPG